MTADELKELAERVGGVSVLARILDVSVWWVHRRMRDHPITAVEAAGIRALTKGKRKAKSKPR